MANTYRRRRGAYDTWHFCSNCTLWPTTNYEERTTPPSDGELCNQCKDKRAKGNCQ